MDSEAEAFRIEVLAKQDDGEFGATTGEATLKAHDVDLFCEIELSRFRAADSLKAQGVLYYTLVELNVTRPLHKMRSDSKYWCEEAIRFWPNARAWVRVRLFNELGETFWQARAVLMMVNVLHKFQEPEEMHKFAKEAFQLFGKVSDRKRQGMSLHGTSLAHLGEGNTAAAVETAVQALAIYRDIGDRRLEIAELKTIAMWRMTLEGNQGRIAAREALEALELSRKYPEPNQETITLHVALQALLHIGEKKQALKAAQISLKRFEGDPRLQMETTTLKVFVDELQGKKTENETDLMEGLKSRKQKMHIMVDLARSHVSHGRPDDAEPLAKEGLEMAREFKKTLREAQALRILAQINLARRNHFEAISLAKKAKKISEKDNDKESLVTTWLLLAQCHAAAKNFDEAQICCREAHGICEETQNFQQELEVWHQVVELHMATSHNDAALQAAAKRLEVAQRNKASIKDQVESLDVICSLFLMTKNIPEAEKSAAEMLRMAKLNESLIDLEIAALVQMVQVNIMRLSEGQGGSTSAGKAMQYAEQAWGLASRDSAGPEYKSSAKYWQAESLVATGRLPQALTASREAEAFFMQLPTDNGGRFRSILLQARLEKALGRTAEAQQSAQRAIKMAEAAGHKANEKMAREELVRINRPQPTDEDDEDDVPRPASVAAATGQRSAGLDRDSVQSKLMQHVRNVLTEDENVATETPLMEMGLDSLSAMDLQNLIATSFPFSGASNTILFDYPTVRELTEHLVEESKLAGL
ncbi:unnamed protein product [Effrenium voratum]|uniref:Carrier domain-containing protein n=1 Tax=Effrenium voratum TaxID=2562239 RepID=A0AA36MMH6_9DINO|nr:unnamed protein product [Effrenium voratum]